MTKSQVEELMRLPPEERLEVAQLLWESVTPEDETRFLPIPAWQGQLLEERLADLDRNPGDEQTWESVKAELWPAR